MESFAHGSTHCGLANDVPSCATLSMLVSFGLRRPSFVDHYGKRRALALGILSVCGGLGENL